MPSTYFTDKDFRGVIPGPAGNLEIMTAYPEECQHKIVAIICHPHPLYEGAMTNKVVTTLFKAANDMGMPTVRFNFRGVGKSDGEYGETHGEIEDLLAVIDFVKEQLPDYEIMLAGFSFGSYIAAKVANDKGAKLLISIAPPVHHFEFTPLQDISCPWLIVQGEQDEVVPAGQVQAWVQQLQQEPDFIMLPGITHFFHGYLIELRQLVKDWLEQQLEG